MIQFFNGTPIQVNNIITNDNIDEKYHVSYNQSRRDYGIDTTALVITIGDNEREVCYILKGNHTKGFNGCNNLKECLIYVNDNKSDLHEYSDKFEHYYLIKEE